MSKRIAVVLLAILATIATAVWAQRGIWDGFTLENVKSKYSDQQIGGFLLHDASTFFQEISRALPKAQTPEQRRLLSRLISKYSKRMERLSIIMGEKKLSQRDIEEFHQYTAKLKKRIREIVP